MRPLFTLLLLCATASAQPGPIPLRSVDAWASSAFTPQSIGGIAYWWSSLDMVPSNSVSAWVDKIQGLTFYQGVSGRQPTNSPSGIYFGSGKMLTNNTGLPAQVYTNNSYVLVLKTFGARTFEDFFVDTSENGFVLQHPSAWNFALRGYITSIVNPFSLSTLLDIFFVPDGSAHIQAYTNNVASNLTGTSSAAGTALTEIGNDNSFLTTDYWDGYIAQIIVYTNYTLTSGDRSNLHNWITNNYSGISP